MTILCSICVWHAIINFLSTNMTATQAVIADKVALCVLGLAYIGFHALFVVIIVCLVSADDTT